MNVSKRVVVVGLRRISKVLPPNKPGVSGVLGVEAVRVELGLAMVAHDLNDLAHEKAERAAVKV